MEVFTYHPDGAESLADFNKRVAEFCLENPVSDVGVSQIGRAIILSMVLHSDFAASQLVLLPFVLAVTPLSIVGLESELSEKVALSESLPLDKSNPDAKPKVLRIIGYGIHGRDEGYAVVFNIIGMMGQGD